VPMRIPARLRPAAEAVAAIILAVVVTATVVVGGRAWHGAPYSVGYSLHAVMCFAVIVCLAALVAAVWGTRRRARWATPLAYLTTAALPVLAYGIPLARTPLWYGGLSYDQQFRTQLITRLADSPALADMNYAGLPTYYPAGWFWPAARLARLLGVQPWLMVKPWSLLTFAVAAVLALLLWRRLVPRLALPVTTVTVLAVLFTSHQEPYSGALAILAPPAAVIAWHALRRGGGTALGFTGVGLGLTVATYTLYAGIAAAVLLVFAIGAYRSGSEWSAVVRRLAGIGGIGVLIGLTVWAPYMLRLLEHPVASAGAAQEFLPTAGAAAWLSFFDPTVLGATTLLGSLWILLRFGSSRAAQALGAILAVVYGWMVASLAAAAFGTTLLGFRVIPLACSTAAAAAVFAAAECAIRLRSTLRSRLDGRAWARTVTVGGFAVLVALAQQATWQLTHDGALAYTDVDCAGHRADGQAPGPRADLPRVHTVLAQLTGRPDRDMVILANDSSFLACHPYRGYTSYVTQYANPLADEPARKRLVDQWSRARTSGDLAHELDTAPIQPTPRAFVFQRTPQGLRLGITRDVFPADPNTEWTQLYFTPAAVTGPEFTVRQVGAYTLVLRH
jgi:galactan 5-O-arabinofuranosyltransferase